MMDSWAKAAIRMAWPTEIFGIGYLVVLSLEQKMDGQPAQILFDLSKHKQAEVWLESETATLGYHYPH